MQIEEEEANTRDRANSCALTAELEAAVLTAPQDAEVDAAADDADDDKETLVNELMSMVSLCCLSYSAIQTHCMHQITKASLNIILCFCL